jgi:hypothetical protein
VVLVVGSVTAATLRGWGAATGATDEDEGAATGAAVVEVEATGLGASVVVTTGDGTVDEVDEIRAPAGTEWVRGAALPAVRANVATATPATATPAAEAIRFSLI